jgi:hypothetical protein
VIKVVVVVVVVVVAAAVVVVVMLVLSSNVICVCLSLNQFHICNKTYHVHLIRWLRGERERESERRLLFSFGSCTGVATESSGRSALTITS